MNDPEITVEYYPKSTRDIPGYSHYLGGYVAHGPDGHRWLLWRTTEAAALADGRAYFLATRVHDGTKWVIPGDPPSADLFSRFEP